MPYKVWSKEHIWYSFFKYKFYKPLRNWICYYGYGYDLSDEENTKRRRRFIEELKK